MVREPGHAAMGQVFLARRTSDGTLTTIKVVRAAGEVSEQSRQLFICEMEILKSLNHPNIVRFIESGSIADRVYRAMEYRDGGNVRDLLKKRNGLMPLGGAVMMLRQTLDGLACAHVSDLVHRDIKPPNLLVGGTPSAGATRGNCMPWPLKIADFGLAKSIDKTGLSGLTATGSYGRALHYMPLEQLVNYKYVRPVSDVWSMAATFYTIVTSRLPRRTNEVEDPVQEILKGEVVPIRRRRADLPARLTEITDQALAVDPANRYPHAAAFRAALDVVA